MAKDLYNYDVLDLEADCCVLNNAPLSAVIRKLNISKSRIINAALYGQKLNKRYLISRTYLDGTKNPIDAESKIMVPEELEKRWDEARFAARKALKNPEAVERFFVRIQKQKATD